jgi:hypothetical protein
MLEMVAPHFPRGSSTFAATSVHTPLAVAKAQNWQVPLQAELQHTPSMQWPDEH